MKSLRRFALLLLALTVVSTAAFAGDDAPSRAVRVKYLSGQVSIQPGGVEQWVAATVNRPLTSNDRVWTDKDSRAELSLGTAALRMDSETSVTLNNVGDNSVQVEIYQGVLNLRVAHLYDGEIYEVDTPNLAFTVLKSGSYRFDVDPNADTTRVTVWKGEGEATGKGPGVRIHSRELMQFSGDKTLVHTALAEPQYDGFDDWCRVRDDREDHARSLVYVSRGTVGYEDLDDYGSWVYIAPYGYVWRPVVVVGWAPYRYGHWVWVSPWGWTWVDDAPWGFAPFHYGRWIYAHDYWAWCPGPVYARPYYAPALVAWVGGRHWGVGFGIGGGVGWFPLGWGEPYWPSYRYSRGYFRNVNINNTRITNITYITNNYYGHEDRYRHVYAHESRAATVVPRDTVINSRSVSNHVVRGPDMRQARVLHNPDLTPSRDSRLGPRRDIAAAAPPSFERRGGMSVPRSAAEARGPVNRPDEGRGPMPMQQGPERNRVGAIDAGNGRHAVPRPPMRDATEANARPERPTIGERTPMSAGNPGRAAREVPRPPMRTPDANEPGARSSGPAAAAGRVPRPPMRTPDAVDSRPSRPAAADLGRVPRPPREEAPRPSNSAGRSTVPDVAPRGGMPRPDRSIDRPSQAPQSPRMNVPRPTGEVRPAPRPQAESRPWSGARGMGRPESMPSRSSGDWAGARSSSPSRGIERPSMPSRGSGGYGGGGSRPSSSPRMSAPSHSSAPSHDGGGARSSHGRRPQ
ncbi:MAG TPA: DUF6600 domain-containing protein [Terriglobales bacterium]|nr:DUF6600 domain-containing protein [Terriglobales bacterium]